MTRLTYETEAKLQSNHSAIAVASNERAQILELKRLLVSMKQHYEKILQQDQIQLQVEQNQRIALQNELDEEKKRSAENQSSYEEELQSLREQQIHLKDLLKKACDDLEIARNQPISKFQTENKEGIVYEQNHKAGESNLNVELLNEKMILEQKRADSLELRLFENQQQSRIEIEDLQRLLEDQKNMGDEIETVVSSTSSHQLRRELEEIKRALSQGTHETKALESRYIETLNQKISLEHHCKQLQLQLEHQSSNLTSFQENLRDAEDHRKRLENSLQEKQNEWIENCKKIQEFETDIERLKMLVKQKDLIEDKYEHLKEEWSNLNERLEEEIEGRQQSDQHLNQLEAIAANQETQLQDFAHQLEGLHQEKIHLEAERDHLRNALEEGEMRLKVAQQHLAKKVKEAAILGEKQEENQAAISEFTQTIEQQKTQLAQLQASVDLYQRQEKRLQDQLHDALRGSESQIAKWEEKYFRMYDKFQESENTNKELKKFEEKHHQIQNLLTNLGSFIGPSGNYPLPRPSFPIKEDFSDNHITSFPTQEMKKKIDSEQQKTIPPEFCEEKYDLFGMRQPIDKFNPSHLS